MKIKIICVGKLKEKYLKDGVEEYLKRIKRFCDIEICELPDVRIPDNASLAECNAVIEKEADKIFEKLSKSSYIVALCVEGKQLTSEEVAAKISSITVDGLSNIDFIIGGSLGLSQRIKDISNFKLSFSKMTFPHQLMRLILTEQIYRAFKINANEEYHK